MGSLYIADRREIDMGFLVTTLIFVVIGIIASLCTRICCNRGPSTNLYISQNPIFFFSIYLCFWVYMCVNFIKVAAFVNSRLYIVRNWSLFTVSSSRFHDICGVCLGFMWQWFGLKMLGGFCFVVSWNMMVQFTEWEVLNNLNIILDGSILTSKEFLL